MKELLDAFWRAAAYCLHPKVIGLSLLPLLLCALIALGLGWLFWEPAMDAVRATLESWQLVDAALRWVEAMVGGSFRTVLAPLIVVMLALPVVVVLSLLLVALLMAPAVVGLIAARRFPALERRRGASLLAGFAWSVLSGALALVAIVVSMPLWLIPPLILILPPMIWGWLAYRVMSFDVLAEHADATERRLLMQRHRGPLLAIGLVTGYLGAAPSLLWAFSVGTLIFAPLLVVISIWLYTLVFAFSTLWFAHYGLAALAALRTEAAAMPAPSAPQISAIDAPPLAPK
ncbi:EI24 domain-containing protein [Aquabacterium humicola]|uniref:EI24 domain-containing protein n=1 Tax=Aquabacterium humicola TaxID=3237377 RepID=UPI002542D809|nr:EI24 domain-containing protein [Rubrivivax pictus]